MSREGENPHTCAQNQSQPSKIQSKIQKTHTPVHTNEKKDLQKTKNPRACAQKLRTRPPQKRPKIKKTHTPVHKPAHKALQKHAKTQKTHTPAHKNENKDLRRTKKPTSLCTKIAHASLVKATKNAKNPHTCT